MVESELKYMITFEEYNQLLNMSTNNFQKQTLIQINYYFDTNEFELDKRGITLRIRQTEKDLKLELKSPISKDGALRVKKEFSRSIDKLPFVINFINDEWSELIQCNSDLYLKGSLITQRTKLDSEDGIEIVLDKSYYLGLIDYELEVEFQEGLKAQAFNVINCFIGDGKELKPSQCGKRKRFFNVLKHSLGEPRLVQ
jgi:uncharacterized protein YjbK